MATAQNPLLSPQLDTVPLDAVLDDLLVEASPAVRALGLHHIVPTANAFGISKETIRREVGRGYLVATTFNGRMYFTKKALIAWIQGWQARRSLRGRRCARNKTGVSV